MTLELVSNGVSTVDSTLDATLGADLPSGTTSALVNAGIVFIGLSFFVTPFVAAPLTAVLMAMKRYRGWN